MLPTTLRSVSARAFNYCSSLQSVFYCGTDTQWNNISIASYDSPLTNANRYYYSEVSPATSGDYWHYAEDGTIEIWVL